MTDKATLLALADKLPAGRLVRVELEICLPVAATPEQVEDWVTCSALHMGGIEMSNPLHHHEVESFNGSVMLTDTGMQGRREEYGHRKEGNSTYYKVRYIRTPA